MDGAQARAVISSGGDLVAPAVAERIIGLAWRNRADAPTADDADRIEIDPALLSVICRELNLRRQAAGAAEIKADLLAGAEREILADFYERTLEGLDPAVRTFVEDELITAAGYRDSFAFDDALARPGVTGPALLHLVSGRLLRVDERSGVKRLELTHDVLTRVVKESRDLRRARLVELEARRREEETLVRQARVRRSPALALVLTACAVALLLFAGWSYWQARQLAREAAATDSIAQARGIPADDLERQLLLGTEAILRYPHRVEAQVELFSRLLSAVQVRKIWHVGVSVTSATAHATGDHVLLGTGRGGLLELAPPNWQPGPIINLHKERVLAVTWTADRPTVVSATEHEVVVSEWPSGQWRMRGTLPKGERGVMSINAVKLAISPDGKSIAVAVAPSVRVWSLAGSSARPSDPVDLRLGAGWIDCLAFDTARPGLFVGTGFDLWRWDRETGRSRTLKRPAGAEFAAFSPDCALAVTTSVRPDRRILLRQWDMNGGRDVGPLGNPRGYQFAESAEVLFSDDGRVAMVRDLRNVDFLSMVEKRVGPLALSNKGEHVYAFAQSADGAWTAVGYGDRLLRLRTGRPLSYEGEFLSRAAPNAQFLFFGTSAGALVAISLFGEVRVLKTQSRRSRFEKLRRFTWQLSSSGTARVTFLATAGQDPEGVQLWDSRAALSASGSRTSIGPSSVLMGTLVAIHRRADGRPLLEIRSLRPSARPAKPIDLPIEEPITALSFSWDNRQLAAATEKGAVTLYDVGSGRVLAKPLRVQSSVSNFFVFILVQDLLAVGSGSGVDLFDVRNGKIVKAVGCVARGKRRRGTRFQPGRCSAGVDRERRHVGPDTGQ